MMKEKENRRQNGEEERNQDKKSLDVKTKKGECCVFAFFKKMVTFFYFPCLHGS